MKQPWWRMNGALRTRVCERPLVCHQRCGGLYALLGSRLHWTGYVYDPFGDDIYRTAERPWNRWYPSPEDLRWLMIEWSPEPTTRCQNTVKRFLSREEKPCPQRLSPDKLFTWQVENTPAEAEAQYQASLEETVAQYENQEEQRRARTAALRRELDGATRWQIFKRDGYRCVTCGSDTDLTVDHRTPVSLGGTNEISNLQTMCRFCNSRKGTHLRD